jgi:anti-sigma factor RsiW
MPEPIQNEISPHHEAEELLPWYVTGQLDGDELALVEQHVSSCAHCRRQLAFERRMADEVASLKPEVDSGWERLRQRIEPRTPHPRQSVWDKVAGDIASFWQGLSRPAVAVMAVAQLAFVVIAGAVLMSLSQPAYRALGSAPPPESANVIAMFDANTSQSQLTDLLRKNGATLVGGPTSADAYLLHVPTQSRTAALERLRSDRHVVMAEPIDKPAS